MKKNNWIIVLITIVISLNLKAKEGMWIPMLVDKLNYDDLKANGFKLSSEDLYSINQASLKDAIVLFGRGCTGEIISNSGLMLTNHHCGFGQIQKHSTVDNNYLREGFWAKNKEEELSNPGLSVKFLVKMEEYTDSVLLDIDNSLPYHEQKPIITKRIAELEASIKEKTNYFASIEKFFAGNEYYLFLYKEYTDVRLVGAPPSSIGNFGGDPDNWVWPRHTGDFSVFRIYSDPDGEPADYSDENIPLKPKKYLAVNAQGINSGDFTMVLGYPGSTREYLYSRELEIYNDLLYPNRIETRDGRLKIIDKSRTKDELIYIQYATKQKRISNAWKKWKGVLYGFNRFKVIEKRKEYEAWLVQNAGDKKNELTDLYEVYEDTYLGLQPYIIARDLYFESINPIEPFELYRKGVQSLIQTEKSDRFTSAATYGESFFKDYNVEVDLKLTKFMLWNFMEKLDEEFYPATMQNFSKKEELDAFVEKAYEKSVYTNKERFLKAIKKAEGGSLKPFMKDPLFILYNEFVMMIVEQIEENYFYYLNQIESLNQEYILLLKEIDKENPMYPDANLTMRMTYGKVEAYSPADAIEYDYLTYLSGVFQKEAIGHEDYVVDEKLRKLFENKDYGKYSDKNGKMPVCFLASNHTSGGNSGSPVLNGNGQLIGINFDRTWEGTMSDFNYDVRICRNISVDIRYVLFIIDKYAEAGYLLEEMDIVW